MSTNQADAAHSTGHQATATTSSESQRAESRREFLAASAAGTFAALASSAAAAPNVAGDGTIRVGLIGCGGRGTGAAAQAAAAGKDVKIVALADLFQDKTEKSRSDLQSQIGAQCDVPDERCFAGFDAYQQLIDCGVDVVLLATTPHFRPQHLAAAVAAGKHVFCEKPVAVDAPGVRKVLEAAAEAKKKNLSLVSGFCYRYHPGMRELMARIHDGAIGKIVALNVSYNTGALWHRDRDPNWSDMEWQLRNWMYFTWASGDHIVEQHVHSIDKAAWAMGDQYPVKAIGTGGRQSRTEPVFGNVFDHFAITYEFADGTRCFGFCRQQQGTKSDVTDWYYGDKGHGMSSGAALMTITGSDPWRFRLSGRRQKDSQEVNMYQVEHNELFASIRNNQPINDGEKMAKSTMMAIMGRMAGYTGQEITWDAALASNESLGPKQYAWGPNPVEEIARPGITRLA